MLLNCKNKNTLVDNCHVRFMNAELLVQSSTNNYPKMENDIWLSDTTHLAMTHWCLHHYLPEVCRDIFTNKCAQHALSFREKFQWKIWRYNLNSQSQPNLSDMIQNNSHPCVVTVCGSIQHHTDLLYSQGLLLIQQCEKYFALSYCHYSLYRPSKLISFSANVTKTRLILTTARTTQIIIAMEANKQQSPGNGNGQCGHSNYSCDSTMCQH